jgi:FG-GAP repeat protein
MRFHLLPRPVMAATRRSGDCLSRTMVRLAIALFFSLLVASTATAQVRVIDAASYAQARAYLLLSGGFPEAAAPAGDVNGDGHPDVIVGAPAAGFPINENFPPRWQGSAYVLLGAEPPRTFDLSESLHGFDIRFTPASPCCPSFDVIGVYVRGVGDFNGDGRDDVSVSGCCDRGNWVVFGQDLRGSGQSVRTTVELSSLGARGLEVVGGGSYIEGGGDVNGDGRSDLLVVGGERAWVIFGTAQTGELNLQSLGNQGFELRLPTDEAATRADLVEDLNGDGRDEIVFGVSDAGHNGRQLSGSTYVVFGRSSIDPVDVGTSGSSTLTIDGAEPGDRAASPGYAGDFNGDGRGDLAVGSPLASHRGRLDSGSVAVFYGPLAPGTIDLAAPGAADVTLDGAAGSTVGNIGDQVGGTVLGVGDLENDGFDDLAVTAPGHKSLREEGLGAVFVIPGRAQPGAIDLASLNSGLRIDGPGGLVPEHLIGPGRAQLLFLSDYVTGLLDVDPAASEPNRSRAVRILTRRAEIRPGALSRRRFLSVELACPMAQVVDCAGVLALRRDGRRIAKSAFSIWPGRIEHVSIPLDRAAERAARRAGRVRAKALVRRPGLRAARTTRRIKVVRTER